MLRRWLIRVASRGVSCSAMGTRSALIGMQVICSRDHPTRFDVARMSALSDDTNADNGLCIHGLWRSLSRTFTHKGTPHVPR